GGLRRRGGVHRDRVVHRARRADRRGGPGVRLHRSAHLLPVDPASGGADAEGGSADDPRLPVALGHRLVLVLAGLRYAESAHPPLLAEALAAVELLLEAD